MKRLLINLKLTFPTEIMVSKYQMGSSLHTFFFQFGNVLFPNQITDPTSKSGVYQLKNWLPFLYLAYLK